MAANVHFLYVPPFVVGDSAKVIDEQSEFYGETGVITETIGFIYRVTFADRSVADFNDTQLGAAQDSGPEGSDAHGR